ncbi:MAG TPA: ATP-binding protein [Rhizomicrobium sp.]|jgi:signal transduction histidine kinase/HAMP domain-containing protein|nr:ATP-binding protein [Rhizomicrobium sp.]
MSVFRKSIGALLFGAFFAMSLIVAAQGYYGYSVLSTAGDMVIDTFDRPLMAVNYARAANFDFAQIERHMLLRKMTVEKDRAKADAEIEDLTAAFFADLGVAEDRSPENDEHREIETIRSLVARWSAARHAGQDEQMDSLARQVDDAFDLLIEFNTDHSFVGRRKAVEAISHFRYALAGGLAGALLIAFLITMLLTRRIARPLSQAASVADRIAGGEFETVIPAGGADETGTLLRSMTVMQDNIRGMMERETQRAASAEVRLTDALETSDEGVMLVNAEGAVVVLNNRLRSFFPGVAEALIPGAHYRYVNALIHSQFVGQHGFLQEQAQDNGEHRLGDGRWIRLSVNPTSEGGKIVFVSDFTDIKQREESFRQAKQDAEAASAAKSRFLANMSHELRTPLNAIIGFSEILNGQIFGALGNARYIEYSGDILRSGRHLLDVINSVLDLSKSEAGKMELKPQGIDLADVLHDCVRMVAEQCAEAKLELVATGLDRELPVFGEAAKLRQIFLNLLSNAAKFTEAGGRIEISTASDASTVCATVSDTGIGMSPQDVQVALTAFGQVDNRLERKYEGTGLGLPLAKSFVELHGGSLDIESAVGHGTKVTVRFARRSAAQAEYA